MLSREAANTNLIVFGLTELGLVVNSQSTELDVSIQTITPPYRHHHTTIPPSSPCHHHHHAVTIITMPPSPPCHHATIITMPPSYHHHITMPPSSPCHHTVTITPPYRHHATITPPCHHHHHATCELKDITLTIKLLMKNQFAPTYFF